MNIIILSSTTKISFYFTSPKKPPHLFRNDEGISANWSAIFSVIENYFDWHQSNISLNCKEYESSVNNLTFSAMLRGWSTDAVWKHFATSLSTETWRHNPFLNGSQCTCMESGQHYTSMGTWNLWTTLQNISSAITSLVQIISELAEGGVKGDF